MREEEREKIAQSVKHYQERVLARAKDRELGTYCGICSEEPDDCLCPRAVFIAEIRLLIEEVAELRRDVNSHKDRISELIESEVARRPQPGETMKELYFRWGQESAAQPPRLPIRPHPHPLQLRTDLNDPQEIP